MRRIFEFIKECKKLCMRNDETSICIIYFQKRLGGLLFVVERNFEAHAWTGQLIGRREGIYV